MVGVLYMSASTFTEHLRHPVIFCYQTLKKGRSINGVFNPSSVEGGGRGVQLAPFRKILAIQVWNVKYLQTNKLQSLNKTMIYWPNFTRKKTMPSIFSTSWHGWNLHWGYPLINEVAWLRHSAWKRFLIRKLHKKYVTKVIKAFIASFWQGLPLVQVIYHWFHRFTL